MRLVALSGDGMAMARFAPCVSPPSGHRREAAPPWRRTLRRRRVSYTQTSATDQLSIQEARTESDDARSLCVRTERAVREPAPDWQAWRARQAGNTLHPALRQTSTLRARRSWALLETENLHEIFCWQEEHPVQPNLTLRYDKVEYPIDPSPENLLLRKQRMTESADFSRSIFRNRAEQEMRAIVVNSGREVTMYRVRGRIQVRHHY